MCTGAARARESGGAMGNSFGPSLGDMMDFQRAEDRDEDDHSAAEKSVEQQDDTFMQNMMRLGLGEAIEANEEVRHH